jgi:hypothetical protein
MQTTKAIDSARLLRVRRERPCCRRTTKKRDEVSPPHQDTLQAEGEIIEASGNSVH